MKFELKSSSIKLFLYIRNLIQNIIQLFSSIKLKLKTLKIIILKSTQKIDHMEGQYISISRRLTLIKSTFSNLLIYTLTLFSIPKGVTSNFERIQKAFLWGGAKLEKSLIVKRRTICLSKEKGGLGIFTL